MLYLASIYRYIFSAIKIRLGNDKEHKKERKRKFLKVKHNCKNGEKNERHIWFHSVKCAAIENHIIGQL